MLKRICLLFTLLSFSSSVQADFGEPLGYRWARVYTHQPGTAAVFNDLFLLPNDEIAYCGAVTMDRLNTVGWFVVTGQDGNIREQVRFEGADAMVRRNAVELMTVIQTDDGGFLVGGKVEVSQYRFIVARISPQGEVIWLNSYASQGSAGPCCYAVIELKEGDFIACGQGENGFAMAIRISPDGQRIWQYHYAGTTLYSMREIEDGIAFANYSSNRRETGLILADLAGNVVTTKRTGQKVAYSLIRSADNGFILAGQSNTNVHLAIDIDSQLNTNWLRMVDAIGPLTNALPQRTYGIARNYDGYLMVGSIDLGGGVGTRICEVFIDLDGNPVWGKWRSANRDATHYKEMRSVVTTNEGAFIACGTGSAGAIALAYEPVAHTPFFIRWNPQDTLIDVLAGDTITFSAVAEDPDGDVVTYRWSKGDQVVGGNDTTVSLTFPERGDFSLNCTATDGIFADSIVWRVHTSDLYISHYSPDSLDIRMRRNTDIEFSAQGRGSQPLPYWYQWYVINPLDGEERLVSEQNSMNYHFNFVGPHIVTVLVGQGETTVQLQWHILTQAAVARWWPILDDIEVPIDSTITFGVVPADSESVDYHIRWIFNDERIGGQRTETIQFTEEGYHTLLATVEQNDLVDTVQWILRVYTPLPNGSEDRAFYPGEYSCTLSPNPFNDVSQIRINLPETAEVKVSLHDMNGRYVKQVEDRQMSLGHHRISFDAGGLPAGVYLIKVDAGDHHSMMKAVLMK